MLNFPEDIRQRLKSLKAFLRRKADLHECRMGELRYLAALYPGANDFELEPITVMKGMINIPSQRWDRVREGA